jgi:anti-anti-sigma regulatory factor
MEQENVQIGRSGSLAILDIRGYVTKSHGVPMRRAFGSFNPEADRSILLRFDKDTYVNSEGIKTIIDLLVEARKKGQKVGITGISSHFEKIFRMVGITKLSHLYRSTEEAEEQLPREGVPEKDCAKE